jgi:dienelactone hydrolase
MIAKTLAKGLIYILGVLALGAVLAVSGVLVATWFEHRVPLELPRPTGSFAVGRSVFHWVEEDRADEFAPVPESKRELVVWVWYPSAATQGARAEYLPPQWRDALARRSGVLMSDFLTRDLSQVRLHSTENAGLPAVESRFPVVILRAGAAALVTGYTALAEDLASHGYIVVGPDAAYRTTVVVFPDGRVVLRPDKYNLELLPESEKVGFANRLINMWSTDLAFVVDQLAKLDAADPSGRFTGRLDLQRLGIFGHSLGGATAADFCHEDSRCKAGIDLDGQLFGPVIDEGLRQPFMFVLEDHGRETDPALKEIFAHFQSMYQRLPVDSRWRITLRGANHFSFSDQMLLKSQLLLGMMQRLGMIGGLDGRRGLEITADCVSSFFDVYLKGSPKSVLDAVMRRYPEILVDRRNVP